MTLCSPSPGTFASDTITFKIELKKAVQHTSEMKCRNESQLYELVMKGKQDYKTSAILAS